MIVLRQRNYTSIVDNNNTWHSSGHIEGRDKLGPYIIPILTNKNGDKKEGKKNYVNIPKGAKLK